MKIIPNWVRYLSESLLVLGIVLTISAIGIRFYERPVSEFLKENAEVVTSQQTFTATDENLIFYPTTQLSEGEDLASYECTVFSASLTSTVELSPSSDGEYLLGSGFRVSGMFSDYYYICASAPESFWFYVTSETEYTQSVNYYKNLYQDLSITGLLIGCGSIAISLILLHLVKKSNQILLASWKLRNITLAGTRGHLRRIRAMSTYRKIAFSAVMLGFGVIITTPMITMMINMIRDEQTSDNYIEYSQSLENAEELLQAAYEYNQNLYENGVTHYGEIEDPYSESGEETSDTTTVDPEVEEYENTLDLGGGFMASVEYPSLGINMPIYHGTDTSTLSYGVGHLYGSSLPVGGENTHAIITAHSGLGTHIMFDRLTLKQFNIGDIFYINVLGETLAYKVIYYNIIDPEGENVSDYLTIQDGKDLVTLFTCYPYQVNTQRMLVTGERIDLELARQLEQTPAIGLEYWLALAAAIVWLVDIRVIAKTWENP